MNRIIFILFMLIAFRWQTAEATFLSDNKIWVMYDSVPGDRFGHWCKTMAIYSVKQDTVFKGYKAWTARISTIQDHENIVTKYILREEDGRLFLMRDTEDILIADLNLRKGDSYRNYVVTAVDSIAPMKDRWPLKRITLEATDSNDRLVWVDYIGPDHFNLDLLPPPDETTKSDPDYILYLYKCFIPQHGAVGRYSFFADPDSGSSIVLSPTDPCQESNHVFNLQGLEIKDPPKGSVYIQNGKKLIAPLE